MKIDIDDYFMPIMITLWIVASIFTVIVVCIYGK